MLVIVWIRVFVFSGRVFERVWREKREKRKTLCGCRADIGPQAPRGVPSSKTETRRNVSGWVAVLGRPREDG